MVADLTDQTRPNPSDQIDALRKELDATRAQLAEAQKLNEDQDHIIRGLRDQLGAMHERCPAEFGWLADGRLETQLTQMSYRYTAKDTRCTELKN